LPSEPGKEEPDEDQYHGKCGIILNKGGELPEYLFHHGIFVLLVLKDTEAQVKKEY